MNLPRFGLFTCLFGHPVSSYIAQFSNLKSYFSFLAILLEFYWLMVNIKAIVTAFCPHFSLPPSSCLKFNVIVKSLKLQLLVVFMFFLRRLSSSPSSVSVYILYMNLILSLF